MSHGITTGIGKHVLTLFEYDKWHEICLDREYMAELKWQQLYTDAVQSGADDDTASAKADEWVSPTQYAINGWSLNQNADGEWEFMQKDGIYANVLRNGDRVIYAINSSEYSNVGEVQLTVWTDKEEDMHAFCKDFKVNVDTVESPGVISQWG